MTDIERTKCKNLAQEIADEVDLSPAVFRAIANTEREIFVPISSKAYSLDAQPIQGDQWISSPLTVAKMTLALECENIDNVLEIGCGSGYQAAVLSKIAHRVFTIERIQILANEAKKRFCELGIKNISVRYEDGNLGWKTYSPYDRILFSAAANTIPNTIFKQLKTGGILVTPMIIDDRQKIIKFIKHSENDIERIELEECAFVPILEGRS